MTGDLAWITWGTAVGWLGLSAIPLVSLEVRRFVHRYDPVYGPVERVVKTQADVRFGTFRWHIRYAR